MLNRFIVEKCPKINAEVRWPSMAHAILKY
jgi:hypothetical protein